MYTIVDQRGEKVHLLKIGGVETNESTRKSERV